MKTGCRSIGRMFLMVLSFVIAPAALVSMLSGQAQAVDVITGKVVNGDLTPAAGVGVQASGSIPWFGTPYDFETTTAADGTFTFNISFSNCISSVTAGAAYDYCPGYTNAYGLWTVSTAYSLPYTIPVGFTNPTNVVFYGSSQSQSLYCIGNFCQVGPVPAPPSPPVISSLGSATGTLGQAFTYQITATNKPTSFSGVGLPGGLSLNTTTGLISGTPTTAGTSTVSLKATNAGGTGSANLTLTVSSAPPAPACRPKGAVLLSGQTCCSGTYHYVYLWRFYSEKVCN